MYGWLCNVFADKTLSFNYLVSKLLFRLLKRIKYRQESDFKELYLFDPLVMEMIRDRQITYIDYDIFNANDNRKFDFIRCLNVLNNACFDEAELIGALKNLFSQLNDEGVLLIGRTAKNGKNNASFLMKRRGKLSNIKDINLGTELKKIIKSASGQFTKDN